MAFDTFIIDGICSICGKYYKNKTRCINIVIDLDDNKLYCKKCALDRAWKEATNETNNNTTD